MSSIPPFTQLQTTVARIVAGGNHGTGFLIAPDMLLTANHVVHDVTDLTVTFLLPTGEYTTSATVELLGSAALDLAILRLPQPFADSTPLPLSSAKPPQQAVWETFGFPSLHLLSGRVYRGQVLQYNALAPWPLTLEVNGVSPEYNLEGLSGSPLVVDAKVCGVLRYQQGEDVGVMLLGQVVEELVALGIVVDGPSITTITPTFNKERFRQLFTPEYTTDYEPFYVAREVDEVFLRCLLSPKNIWLHGASGTGKTCLANRNLQQQTIQHIYCYLTALPNPRNATAILQMIAEDITEKYPTQLRTFTYKSTSDIKQLAHLLAHLFPTDNFIICIDEVHIKDSAVFEEFVNSMTAVCAEYRNCRASSKVLKFIISTIQQPAIYHYNIAKFNEQFSFIELTHWNDQEIEQLLGRMNTIGHLLAREEQSIVVQASQSPRIAKDIVHQYALNYKQQTLEQVIEYVVARS
ncbi:trypsin-like peptidase domain-containing protein [Hymenobacter sp. BT186]|uniref:Trypsin-like peptidase domain-containing protein n=1 Tax=Hymenobacter telluris TaxID=2816474 RepID=A0A939F0C8_9BACT|nr:serine protease [Hymenobacter telluris]MBO0360828.1 trypsin-like peptidase domain-containing protein [Hymenobacter telluris]MBW3376857.1 trypsin-like peptidase domain-containing protein [Hymenobacter norwichensis]